MLNQDTVQSQEYDCLGFEFEPLGTIRLKRWHITEKNGKVAGYQVTTIDPIITDALLVNPATLKIAANIEADPAAVPAFTYVATNLFGGIKSVVEGFVTVNGLIQGGAQ